MNAIPAIDIIDGKCVRLTKGQYQTRKIYASNPVAVAQQFESAGFEYLHIVDLDGAKAGTVQNIAALEAIAAATQLKIDFSGGIRTREEARQVLEAGAWKITIGSLAIKNPQEFTAWLDEFGPEKFILGADSLAGEIKISGWTEETGVNLKDFIQRYLIAGIETFMVTDIAKDGMLNGPACDLYADLIATFPQIKLIASGGITTLKDLEILDSMGIEGAIIGKALYENRLSAKDILEIC